MDATQVEQFRRYAARANDLLVQAGVTTPDAPIVWVRDDSAVMINQIMYRPAGLNLDAARDIGQQIHAQYGAESRIGELAAAWYTSLLHGTRLWSPADGQQIANDAYTLAARLTIAEEG